MIPVGAQIPLGKAPKSHGCWVGPFFPLSLLFLVAISPFPLSFSHLLGSIPFSRLQNPAASKVFSLFFPNL